jgi:hypothetical protein
LSPYKGGRLKERKLTNSIEIIVFRASVTTEGNKEAA